MVQTRNKFNSSAKATSTPGPSSSKQTSDPSLQELSSLSPNANSSLSSSSSFVLQAGSVSLREDLSNVDKLMKSLKNSIPGGFSNQKSPKTSKKKKVTKISLQLVRPLMKN